VKDFCRDHAVDPNYELVILVLLRGGSERAPAPKTDKAQREPSNSHISNHSLLSSFIMSSKLTDLPEETVDSIAEQTGNYESILNLARSVLTLPSRSLAVEMLQMQRRHFCL
jgi:hypothetical protein